ncbi:hypothetical protein Gogos_020559, partial [Gossypium gossypioides]|nr:hypothetical protein [Gossypium gossypioides]
NNFGSVGCGNLATVLSNEADSLAGCVQPRCDDGASESGCFTLIPGNFTSYTVNMTAMYPDSIKCASAFIFSVYSFSSAYPLPTGINIGTTHVPAVLSWNSTYCGDAGGCLQPSCRINKKTSSNVVCSLAIPKGLNSFFANMSDMVNSSDYRRKRSCGCASLISYNIDLTDDFNLSNRTHAPTQLQWGTLISGECYL